jgi:hypothetical protein
MASSWWIILFVDKSTLTGCLSRSRLTKSHNCDHAPKFLKNYSGQSLGSVRLGQLMQCWNFEELRALILEVVNQGIFTWTRIALKVLLNRQREK